MSRCKGHFDDKEKGFYVCSLCECSPGIHCYQLHCPLFDEEMICTDCCSQEVSKDDVISKLQKIGVEYTRKEIDDICRKCGSRPVDGESNGNAEQSS